MGGSASLWLRQKNRKMQETCVFTVATKEKDSATVAFAARGPVFFVLFFGLLWLARGHCPLPLPSRRAGFQA